MTQIDGATTSKEDRLLIMGATNIPWELDEAVLRCVRILLLHVLLTILIHLTWNSSKKQFTVLCYGFSEEFFKWFFSDNSIWFFVLNSIQLNSIQLNPNLFRRLVKRIYVPLPDVNARTRLVTHLMTKQVFLNYIIYS